MVYYLQQNVALLDQISRQIVTIAPQVTIPSTPPPFSSFKPSENDIRVNVFWFMALIFSLVAAFLAILTQQWVRNYMHVFQRYSDPLKCARLRQYLHDGLEEWHMPFIAETVPCFLHVSLFLFFVGLCDSVLNINTTVGVWTTVPIAISAFGYIFATCMPVIYPQSPYQNLFSVVLWLLTQRLREKSRQYQDRGPDEAGRSVSWSWKMAQERMHLAMEETEKRMGRDKKAIRWLIDNMTEDAEMESLVMAIPGSFNGKWGLEVWENVSASKPPANDPHTGSMGPLPGPDPSNVRPDSTTAHIQGEHIMHTLNERVSHLLETCKNRDLFASDELWRKRTRGCVETIVSLVSCAGVELDQFVEDGQLGDMVKLLGEIGVDPKVREPSSVGKDQMFVMRWTCLSLVAIQPILASDQDLHNHAELAISSLSEVRYHTVDKQTPTDIIDNALTHLETLSRALPLVGNMNEEQAKESLHVHGSLISELERIVSQDDDNADEWIRAVQCDVDRTTRGIIRQLPGIKFDDAGTEGVSLDQLKESYRDGHKIPFIFPSHILKRIRELTRTFRNILDGQVVNVSLKDLQEVIKLSVRDNSLRRELWRLQDLNKGGGLGFTVELFFLALRQLLSTSSSKESHSALLIGTFQAIQPDWSEYKSPLGTQMLLLEWVVSDNGIIFHSTDAYPDPIVDEFLKLLGNVLKGQRGAHIDDVVKELTEKSNSAFLIATRRAFYEKALGYIPSAGTQGPSS
jgi:hypothetical protein